MNHGLPYIPVAIGLCNYLLAATTLLAIGDLLDAPGPGYRKQAAILSIRPEPSDQQILRALREPRPELFPSPEQRATPRKRIIRRFEQFRGVRVDTSPFSLTLELQRLNHTLPLLPAENPFDRPIRLFALSSSSAPGREHMMNGQ